MSVASQVFATLPLLGQELRGGGGGGGKIPNGYIIKDELKSPKLAEVEQKLWAKRSGRIRFPPHKKTVGSIFFIFMFCKFCSHASYHLLAPNKSARKVGPTFPFAPQCIIGAGLPDQHLLGWQEATQLLVSATSPLCFRCLVVFGVWFSFAHPCLEWLFPSLHARSLGKC